MTMSPNELSCKTMKWDVLGMNQSMNIVFLLFINKFENRISL